MGLDMYLFKKRDDVDFGMEIGYWRKANQIHNWFVENCQDGIDECQETLVPFEKLMELKNLCKKALKNRDTTLLPPRAGVFFGCYEYNEWYWDDIKQTVKILSKIKNDGHDEFYYQSSW